MEKISLDLPESYVIRSFEWDNDNLRITYYEKDNDEFKALIY